MSRRGTTNHARDWVAVEQVARDDLTNDVDERRLRTGLSSAARIDCRMLTRRPIAYRLSGERVNVAVGQVVDDRKEKREHHAPDGEPGRVDLRERAGSDGSKRQQRHKREEEN